MCWGLILLGRVCEALIFKIGFLFVYHPGLNQSVTVKDIINASNDFCNPILKYYSTTANLSPAKKKPSQFNEIQTLSEVLFLRAWF